MSFFEPTKITCKYKNLLVKIELTLISINKEEDLMSYEKFITDFLNIKPSDLSKISTSTGSDGSVFIRIRLSKKSVLCPFCNGSVKVKAYYDRKLTHSTFANRF